MKHPLSSALNPKITTTTRYLQNLSKKEADKIIARDNLSISEKDRIGFNRQNVQTKIFILVRDILKKELKNPNEVEIISEYHKNKDAISLFHYTVNYKNGNNLEISYNSNSNGFSIVSNHLDKETTISLEGKLSNAMTNVDTFIKSAADLTSIEVEIHQDDQPLFEIRPSWDSVKDEDGKFLYEASESYGTTYPDNIYAQPKDFSVTALVEFYNTGMNMYAQENVGVTFFAEGFGEGIVNRMDMLSPFVKTNTMINIFEQTNGGLFSKTLDHFKSKEEFHKNCVDTVKALLKFAKGMGEKITEADLKAYSKVILEEENYHGFQHIVENYISKAPSQTNKMK